MKCERGVWIYRKMVQLQQARLVAMKSLQISRVMNTILDNDEAEIGAMSSDDLGKHPSYLLLTY